MENKINLEYVKELKEKLIKELVFDFGYSSDSIPNQLVQKKYYLTVEDEKELEKFDEVKRKANYLCLNDYITDDVRNKILERLDNDIFAFLVHNSKLLENIVVNQINDSFERLKDLEKLEEFKEEYLQNIYTYLLKENSIHIKLVKVLRERWNKENSYE